MHLDLLQLYRLEYDVKNFPDTENLPQWLNRLPGGLVDELKGRLLRNSFEVLTDVNYYRASSPSSEPNPSEPLHPFMMRGNPQPPLQRANFPNVSVLYASEDETTAIAEVLRRKPGTFEIYLPGHPEALTTVTMGVVKLKHPIKMCDLSMDDGELEYNLAERMSLQVDSLEKREHYFVTSTICHIARQTGADGVMFRSSWNPTARNIALFDARSFYVDDRPTLKSVLLKP